MDYELHPGKKKRRLGHSCSAFGTDGSAEEEYDYNMNPSSMLKIKKKTKTPQGDKTEGREQQRHRS